MPPAPLATPAGVFVIPAPAVQRRRAIQPPRSVSWRVEHHRSTHYSVHASAEQAEPRLPFSCVMQIYRSTFGGHRCEIAVWRSSSGPLAIVAWASGVRSDGRLDPFVRGHGALVREYAETPEKALTAIRRRLVAMLGDESTDPAVTFPTTAETPAQTPAPHNSTPLKRR